MPQVQFPRNSSVSRDHTTIPARFSATAISTYTNTVRLQVQQMQIQSNLGIKTVDVFLKNTTVGDVMFMELDNFKKSYNYGDIQRTEYVHK